MSIYFLFKKKLLSRRRLIVLSENAALSSCHVRLGFLGVGLYHNSVAHHRSMHDVIYTHHTWRRSWHCKLQNPSKVWNFALFPSGLRSSLCVSVFVGRQEVFFFFSFFSFFFFSHKPWLHVQNMPQHFKGNGAINKWAGKYELKLTGSGCRLYEICSGLFVCCHLQDIQ